jgi:hypothetical protein
MVGPNSTSSSTGTGSMTTGGGQLTPAQCADGTIRPGRAPLRRLTHFEYNNTVHDILGDLGDPTYRPADALPADTIGNGFGNDANQLSVSDLLAEEYGTVAAKVASMATATPAALGALAPCGSSVTAANEDACARTIISSVAAKAYRRDVTSAEVDELVTFEKGMRAQPQATFATSIAAVLEVVLQAPDFLYRLEFGTPDAAHPGLQQLTGSEMATRLSYFFWGTSPDDTLSTAGKNGDLASKDGVLAQANRLLADPRSHSVVRFFFDNFLPISGLTTLERDKTQYPAYTATLGNYMHEETQRFLEYEIFSGPGSWQHAFTADYSFLNGPLAQFYGLPAIAGTDFQKVSIDTTKRLGFLTQAGLMAGTTNSNSTSPVLRGGFVVRQLMCRVIPLPTGAILAQVKPPDPYSGKTARERFSQHSANPVCATCHHQMDPVGLALENYDPIGQWRTQENGETIDATGSVPGSKVTVTKPTDLVQQIAITADTHTCFADNWLNFGYGKVMGDDDSCTKGSVEDAFVKSGYNVKQLLLNLTQTDEFLYFAGSQ